MFAISIIVGSRRNFVNNFDAFATTAALDFCVTVFFACREDNVNHIFQVSQRITGINFLLGGATIVNTETYNITALCARWSMRCGIRIKLVVYGIYAFSFHNFTTSFTSIFHNTEGLAGRFYSNHYQHIL